LLGKKRGVGSGAELVQVGAEAEDDLFGVKDLAGGGGVVLGAAAALNAAVGLEGDELRDVLAGYEAKVFVTGERWDLGEAVALEEDRDGESTRWRCLVCGMSGRKTRRARVWVHQRALTSALPSATKKAAR